MNNTYDETILLGVPHYQQGHADGLCVYYAMAMVLVALYPEYHKTINEPPRHKKRGSPIFLMLKELAHNDKNFNEEVGKWYFNGMKMTDATRLLNYLSHKHDKSTQKTDHFIRRRFKGKKGVYSIDDIRNALSAHLPVIIAIAVGGKQRHAVVAVGWGKEGRRGIWIIYHDHDPPPKK